MIGKYELYQKIKELFELRDKQIEEIKDNPFIMKKVGFFWRLAGGEKSQADYMIDRVKIRCNQCLLELIDNYGK